MTGISMFEITDETDAGDLYGQKEIPIGPRTTVTELVDAVAVLSVLLVTESLPLVANGSMRKQRQIGTPSFSLQRIPADGQIDWKKPACEIDRLVRSVTKPYPGAFADFEGRRATIWKTDFTDKPLIFGAPGQIARVPGEQDPVVVTGQGNIVIRAADIDGDDAVELLRRSSNKRFTLS